MIFTIYTCWVFVAITLMVVMFSSINDDDFKLFVIFGSIFVVHILINVFVLPPADEWSAKRYDEAIVNLKDAREKYSIENACKDSMTNYCLVTNKKKLNVYIQDSIDTFNEYVKFN